jgi:hypothetical protein
MTTTDVAFVGLCVDDDGELRHFYPVHSFYVDGIRYDPNAGSTAVSRAMVTIEPDHHCRRGESCRNVRTEHSARMWFSPPPPTDAELAYWIEHGGAFPRPEGAR